MTAERSALVVEDDARTADLMSTILRLSGFTRVETSGTAREAEAHIREVTPDLILVDLRLPDLDGVALIRDARQAAFRNPILVVTSVTSDEQVLAALGAGANGYLFKEDLDVRLGNALRELADGGLPLSPGAAQVVLRQIRPERAHGCRRPHLTSREAAVLEHLATGASYAEIGRELEVQLNTVRTHIRSLYDKLGVENRAEAVNLAWNLSILRRED
jgi:DNA-binding NarL/FixJ family response regulator